MIRTVAHLPPEQRPLTLGRWLRRERRSLSGWIIFVAFIVLNETRGIYVVLEVLQAGRGLG